MADVDPLLGRMLWYELLPADREAAERFYTEVVGWNSNGKVTFRPMAVPGGGWVVNGLDPQGAAFASYHEH
jgi:predicted enzyme related to lactoylglutathione lyase